jgi:hypothetical protein
MTTAEKGQIVGLGLYLELVPKNTEDKRTTQILFTPEGFDVNGNYVQFAMLSRTISDWSPRKQWRINLSGIDNRAYFATPSGTTPELPADVLTTMTTRFEKSLERYLTGQEVELRSKPIVVEITSIDLADIREYKAPTPALRRLQKARVSLGFPEKLF